ncbi:fatty acid synthase alpha subunit Lsd1 [Blastocladiella emersonii ATCC 22665]|nr:fatty acid synthase alpha subunit Lsd1 [Blastocladiella emersonii ATCC 22665]
MVHMEQTLTVGHVMFRCDHPLAVQTSPIVAMLQRLGGITIKQPCLFKGAGNGAGYTVHTSTFTAPASNTAYASVLGDYNPIHANPLLADLASLPDTITHGMWTLAMTRRVVELHAAENQPLRVLLFAVDFVNMCVPNTELTTTLRHVGMQNGRKIIAVTTAAAANSRVFVKGAAQVAQATSCFGLQEVGMGMDLYALSPVAREIWDRADAHFKRKFGFLIIKIVRTNPKAKTVGHRSSNCSMCAVNPARVNKFFKEKDLEDLVAHVRTVTGSLLEIVNYNVDGWQYVVAGDLQGLNALTLVLNAVARGVFDQAKLEELVRTADLKSMPLTRGHATILLAGIDVPFDSSFLLPGVAPFRKYLKRKIKPAYIHAQRLEARYILNLTAKPFRVTRVQIVVALLPKLALASSKDNEVVAHVLLTELLAYQFASALSWIKTQNVSFTVSFTDRALPQVLTTCNDALTFPCTTISYVINRR